MGGSPFSAQTEEPVGRGAAGRKQNLKEEEERGAFLAAGRDHGPELGAIRSAWTTRDGDEASRRE